MNDTEPRRRSKAGLSTLRQHRKRMLPWSYPLFGALLAAALVTVLFLLGLAPLWAMLACLALVLAAYRLWDKKTDAIYNRWGVGARAERLVGAELEKLHREGFYVFHDWEVSRGNVDHFAVGPQGVFAVETKSWTGEITAEGGRLKKDGRFVYENAPIVQAMRNAFAVRRLVGESHGTEPFVVPVLCFSRAEVRCYRPVSKVEVVGVGALARVIMDRRVRYSASEVAAIAEALEERLGVGPAARPGLPPEEPTRTEKVLDKAIGLSGSATVLLSLGVVFALSLVFPAQSSKLLLGVAYLYHLLSEALGRAF
jgi:hypothetical protein